MNRYFSRLLCIFAGLLLVAPSLTGCGDSGGPAVYTPPTEEFTEADQQTADKYMKDMEDRRKGTYKQ